MKAGDIIEASEYVEGEPVELGRLPNGRFTVTATNEGGYNATEVNLQELIEWVAKHSPQMLVDALMRQGDGIWVDFNQTKI